MPAATSTLSFANVYAVLGLLKLTTLAAEEIVPPSDRANVPEGTSEALCALQVAGGAGGNIGGGGVNGGGLAGDGATGGGVDGGLAAREHRSIYQLESVGMLARVSLVTSSLTYASMLSATVTAESSISAVMVAVSDGL